MIAIILEEKQFSFYEKTSKIRADYANRPDFPIWIAPKFFKLFLLRRKKRKMKTFNTESKKTVN